MCKIIFLGTSDFAVPILKELIKKKKNIISVYTQPPNKSNRGQKLNKSPIHILSDLKNIPVRTPIKIIEDKDFLLKESFDLGIVVAYGQILPKYVLNIAKFGFINIHASLLPTYRGAAPIQRAIMNSEKVTGISIMKINKEMDAGPICNQYEIDIDDKDNFISLSKKLSYLSSEKIIENINLVLSNKVKFREQAHRDATYAKKIQKLEGKINWNENAYNIHAKVKGLFPNPGAWFEFKNERYKILKSIVIKIKGEPGKVLDHKFTIACGKNSIQVTKIQRQGRTPQDAKDFLLGSKIKKGCILNNE